MNKITLQIIEELFAGVRAKTDWEVDGDMLWGYFFCDPDPAKLEPLAEHLVQLGYRVVSIHETEDGGEHFLHVERVETHTPRSLHERNGELQRLAYEYDIESYDGMDVGPAGKA